MQERVLELKAEVLKALAQPTRLKILELLRNGEKCICEIIPAINGDSAAPIFSMKYWIDNAVLRTSGRVMS